MVEVMVLSDPAFPITASEVDLRTSLGEQELLREVILCLSGASGTLVQYNPSLDAFVPPNNLMLSPSVQSNILRICECGWLHNRIRRFVDGVRDDKTSGKLMLALALAIEEQLSEYYRLVATLEVRFCTWLESFDCIFSPMLILPLSPPALK
ncbi:unnamed protein product [Dibothriocephalus latus]|uniref:Gamma tubulin complex component protein N-terminal domain-containing protein n=1 Tax=Dibothriocephalus latus TaxID=60516 RepID=A0A3P7NW49_DIBLA|nr:unnamed protein product [Dibothriocephalus latus]